jgi:hypothetical protein
VSEKADQAQYAILYRVHEAKKPETRAKRIADFLRMFLATPHRPHRQLVTCIDVGAVHVDDVARNRSHCGT